MALSPALPASLLLHPSAVLSLPPCPWSLWNAASVSLCDSSEFRISRFLLFTKSSELFDISRFGDLIGTNKDFPDLGEFDGDFELQQQAKQETLLRRNSLPTKWEGRQSRSSNPPLRTGACLAHLSHTGFLHRFCLLPVSRCEVIPSLCQWVFLSV